MPAISRQAAFQARFASKLAPTIWRGPRYFRVGSKYAAMDVAGMARSYGSNRHALALDLCSCPWDFQGNIRTRRMPLSGGLVELEFQGLSGMDAARAAMGQGWPFAAGP